MSEEVENIEIIKLVFNGEENVVEVNVGQKMATKLLNDN